jgi:hypothetical protein
MALQAVDKAPAFFHTPPYVFAGNTGLDEHGML